MMRRFAAGSGQAWTLAAGQGRDHGRRRGLTELLPISSTGHLILAASLLGLTGEKVKVFEIAIQTGAMFAVILEYRAKLAATVAGLRSEPRAALRAQRDHRLHAGGRAGPRVRRRSRRTCSSPCRWPRLRHRRPDHPVGRAPPPQALGERDWGPPPARVETVDDMTALDALKVGLVQCVALIPGTSRSGATIIGAMLFGFWRKAATEFSFFLGIPTLMGAGAYWLYKQRHALDAADLPLFAVGLAFAFISASRVRALAHPLRLHARLRALRVVSHRVRRAGAGHGLAGAVAWWTDSDARKAGPRPRGRASGRALRTS